jgi:hypothetical protein
MISKFVVTCLSAILMVHHLSGIWLDFCRRRKGKLFLEVKSINHKTNVQMGANFSLPSYSHFQENNLVFWFPSVVFGIQRDLFGLIIQSSKVAISVAYHSSHTHGCGDTVHFLVGFRVKFPDTLVFHWSSLPYDISVFSWCYIHTIKWAFQLEIQVDVSITVRYHLNPRLEKWPNVFPLSDLLWSPGNGRCDLVSLSWHCLYLVTRFTCGCYIIGLCFTHVYVPSPRYWQHSMFN